ncbi:MAPEG family protein [Aquibium microcysteis]|uniref:MAPEG family protein n=1 Tax=Aquibium microcysteis TaxID=675281 RepID=UPI00165D149B|nr:MAPEG family protein [Aquibium microcysteis]
MEADAIFWPMIAHVALVYGVYGLMALRRKRAVETGSAKISQFRENRDEPAESLFVRNNLANQFELPVLFHACCLALFASGGVGAVVLVFAWVFVASRYVHAAIHVTTNRIRHRQPAFIAGFLSLGAMWGALAVHIA